MAIANARLEVRALRNAKIAATQVPNDETAATHKNGLVIRSFIGVAMALGLCLMCTDNAKSGIAHEGGELRGRSCLLTSS